MLVVTVISVCILDRRVSHKVEEDQIKVGRIKLLELHCMNVNVNIDFTVENSEK